MDYSSRMTHATSVEDLKEDTNILHPVSTSSNRMISDTGYYEDWFGSEVMIPRDTDRILEQFGVMMLRIGAYLSKEGVDCNDPNSQIFNSTILPDERRNNLDSTTMPPDDTDPPPLVGSSNGRTASYLREYPQIFMKKLSDFPLHSDLTLTLTSDHTMGPSQRQKNHTQYDENDIVTSIQSLSDEDVSVDREKILSSQNSNPKGTSQKKLQTRSSEKSVTFKQIKLKPTLQGVNSSNNLIGEQTEKPEDIHTKSEKDSLESIIKDMKTRESNKEK